MRLPSRGRDPAGAAAARSSGVIRFENVGLRYGTGPEVLRDVTFTLESGSFHFLSGPSGAGKTSLLRLMYLSLLPSRGLITLLGHELATLQRRHWPRRPCPSTQKPRHALGSTRWGRRRRRGPTRISKAAIGSISPGRCSRFSSPA